MSTTLPQDDKSFMYPGLYEGFPAEDSTYENVPEEINRVTRFIERTLPFEYEDYGEEDFSIVYGRCYPSNSGMSQHWITKNYLTDALYNIREGLLSIHELWADYVKFTKPFYSWLQVDYQPSIEELVRWSRYRQSHAIYHSHITAVGVHYNDPKQLLYPVSSYYFKYPSSYAIAVTRKEPLKVFKVRYSDDAKLWKL